MDEPKTMKQLVFTGSADVPPPPIANFCIYGGSFTQGTLPFEISINGGAPVVIGNSPDVGLALQAVFGGNVAGAGFSGNAWYCWVAVPNGDPNPLLTLTWNEFGNPPQGVEINLIGDCNTTVLEPSIMTLVNGDVTVMGSWFLVTPYTVGEWEVFVPYDSVNIVAANATIKSALGQQAGITVTILDPGKTQITLTNTYYDPGSGSSQTSTDDGGGSSTVTPYV